MFLFFRGAICVGWGAALDVAFRQVFARKERFTVITDTTPLVTMPSAMERKAITDWAARPDHLELQKRFNLGSSTIIKNTLVRGTLQALYWVWTPGSAQHVARDFDESWAWCIEQLATAKVALPEPAAELKRRVQTELRSRRAG